MFDPKKIEEISKRSKNEKWEFPRTFEALKDAGVLYYEVETATHQITYFGDHQTHLELPPSQFTTLTIAKNFDSKGIAKAIERHRREKTHYLEFLQDIVQAGVSFYRVEMMNRQVVYCGALSGEEYAEKIPASS